MITNMKPYKGLGGALLYLSCLHLLLDLPPLFDKISYPLSCLSSKSPESCNHSIAVTPSFFLTHLELALKALNLDFNTDNCLFHELDVSLRRIRHLPRFMVAILAIEAHEVELRVT